MKYFGQGDDYINAECEKCGAVLKINKSACEESESEYLINRPIKCPKCGTTSNKITKEAKKTVAKKKKGFWAKLAEDFERTEEKKKEKANEPIRCPKCGSTQIAANKKGFGVGKAIAGDLLLGPVGLLGGAIGKNKIYLTCLKCGHKWKAGKGK